MDAKNQNLYLAFMRSELNEMSMFFDFKTAHDKYIAENVWSETDQMLALYSLVKEVLKLDIQKSETRSAAMRKIKNIQADAAKRML